MPSTICFEITLTLADMNDMDIPGNSAGDLFGMVKWPFQKSSHLQLRDQKVTLNRPVDSWFEIWAMNTTNVLQHCYNIQKNIEVYFCRTPMDVWTICKNTPFYPPQNTFLPSPKQTVRTWNYNNISTSSNHHFSGAFAGSFWCRKGSMLPSASDAWWVLDGPTPSFTPAGWMMPQCS